MKRITSLSRAAVFALTIVGATAAGGSPMPLASNLTSADPLQFGRLSRNGIAQDESGGLPGLEAFPGVINPTTAYHFHVYSLSVGPVDTLVYVSIDSASPNTFLAAYQGAYFVTNPAATWLGDAGTSVNDFEGGPIATSDPLSFNFLAAANSNVLLVVNETSTNGGLTSANPFILFAQEFSPDFVDGPIDVAIVSGGQVIPEPSTVALLGLPLLALGLRARRRSS